MDQDRRIPQRSHARLLKPQHFALDFNAPLSNERATRLVREFPSSSYLDLGCGWGELLLHMLAHHRTATGIGIDRDEEALERARANAKARSIDRVTFTCADASTFPIESEAVICVGSTHAFGGTERTLTALRGRRVLLGEGFWEKPPTPALEEMFVGLHDREGLRASCERAGFRVRSIDTSTLAEWDAFESAWSTIPERKREYEEGYRGVLGFAWLLLD